MGKIHLQVRVDQLHKSMFILRYHILWTNGLNVFKHNIEASSGLRCTYYCIRQLWRFPSINFAKCWCCACNFQKSWFNLLQWKSFKMMKNHCMFLSCHVLFWSESTLSSCLNSKELLVKTGVISEVQVTVTGLEPTTT